MEQRPEEVAKMNYKMNYIDRLKEKESILSVGLDPIIEKIPIKDKTNKGIEKTIFSFFKNIIEAIDGENIPIGAVKPNIPYYEQYGFEGLRALKKVIELAKGKDHIVILDAKRGDIAKTNAVYAKAIFDFWEVDAVTVNPFLGSDSLQPFFEYCKKGKGIYILTKTSNPSSSEFQDPMKIAQMINKHYTPGIGSVIGATFPGELKRITKAFKQPVPLLIPGIGAQAGSLEAVPKERIHRIHATSSIIYAYEKDENGSSDYVGAALKEIRLLNSQIGKIQESG